MVRRDDDAPRAFVSRALEALVSTLPLLLASIVPIAIAGAIGAIICQMPAWGAEPSTTSPGLVSLVSLVSPVSLVSGKVVGWDSLVPKVYAEAAARESHRYTWREPSPEAKRPSADVTRDVCVAAFGATTSVAHDPVSVHITGGRLTPSTIVLSPSSHLVFRNVDPFPHMLYEANSNTWAANPMGPGSTREWTATSPGIHQIRDQLFVSIVMYVLVDPGAVEFARPDREGFYSMALPRGDYSFKAFFDGRQVGKSVAGIHVDTGSFQFKQPIDLREQ